MAKAYSLKTSFNSGLLDTRMQARVDVNQYYNGMAQADNVVCLPQGGVKRRPGMQFVYDIGTTYCRAIPFEFNVEQAYVLVFRNLFIDVFRDDVFKVSVASPYTTAQIPAIKFAQSADTMIIVHEDHPPKLFQRMGSDTSWSIANAVFQNVPQYDFNDASSPTPVNEVQDVTVTGVDTGSSLRFTLEGIETESVNWPGADTADRQASFESDLEAALLELPNTGSSGISVVYQGGGTPTAGTFRVTFSGSSANPWRLIGGRVYEGNLTGDEVIYSARIATGTTRKEDVWSATRGYPKSVTFHEGRLWFGGSTQRPITFWGSKVNDVFNFDLGRSRDDSAMDVTLDVDQYDEIQSIFSNRHLQIFTAGAEFYVTERPITPGNIAAARQSGYGASIIQPKVIDGATIYIQRTGTAMREFVFDFAEEAYLSNTASFLAPSVLQSPVDMAVTVGTVTEDANYVYVVNSDGTMAVFNTLRAQDVAGWSKWNTQGSVISITRLVDDIYMTVLRNGNYLLEKLNNDCLTDSSVLYDTPGTDTLTGLDHLDGLECAALGDTFVLANVTPVSGSVTIELTAEDSAEVGLFFAPTVQTMPIEKDIGTGYNLDSKKRLVKVSAFLQDSTDLTINGYDVTFRSFGDDLLDQPITPFTGKKEMYLNGWSKTATVTVTQTVPAKFTLLALSVEMEFT